MTWVMSSKSISGHFPTAALAASMNNLVASTAKISLRTLVLGLSTRPVAGSKNEGFSEWLSRDNSATAVNRVSIAAESKQVRTSRDPSRVRPG